MSETRTPYCPCAGACHHSSTPCSLGCWAAQKPWRVEEARDEGARAALASIPAEPEQDFYRGCFYPRLGCVLARDDEVAGLEYAERLTPEFVGDVLAIAGWEPASRSANSVIVIARHLRARLAPARDDTSGGAS